MARLDRSRRPQGDVEMIKLVTFLKRRPELTRDQFADRWLTVHAPLAAVFPGLRGYMLSFPIAPPDAEPSADGIAQLWFDSEEAAQASYGSDVGRAGSRDASGNLSRRQHLFASERWIVPAATLAEHPFKLLLAGKRLDGVSRDAFVTVWEAAAVELADAVAGAPVRVCVDRRGKMLNSGTSGTLDLVDGEPVHDGLIEIWARSQGEITGLEQRTDELQRPLLGIGTGLEVLATRERVIVKPPPPAYGQQG